MLGFFFYMMREIIVFLYFNENDSSEGNYVDAEKKKRII